MGTYGLTLISKSYIEKILPSESLEISNDGRSMDNFNVTSSGLAFATGEFILNGIDLNAKLNEGNFAKGRTYFQPRCEIN